MADGWVVLPDIAGTSRIHDGRWPSRDDRTVRHASGRPWLIGRWSTGELTVATLGSTRVAVIGSCPVSATRLTELIARVRVPADLNAVAAVLPGAFHLVASLNGDVRVQGDVVGLHGVVHTNISGITIAGDRASLLARIRGPEIDDQALAVRLACGSLLPPPIDAISPWRGVRTLSPDEYLLLTSDGTAREVRWWRPPDPELSLAEGIAGLRDALNAAVPHRSPASGRLSADLSGGMDSTSLCFLAARNTPDLLTIRWGEAEKGNDDATFAAVAAGVLDRAEHVVIAQHDLPDIFADCAGGTDLDAPYPFTRTQARVRHTARVLAARGSTRHLTGHGGDELFVRSASYLHTLIRRKPWIALRHLRANRVMDRWPLTVALAALADSRGPTRWWLDQANALTDPLRSRFRTPVLGWYPPPPRAPGWVTPAGIDAARQALRTAATRARRLAGDSGQHTTLMTLRTLAPHYRLLARLFAGAGVRMEMPYLDRQVVEATLRVRLTDRAHPWRYKPLLTEAMRGTLPDPIRGRATKGEFSADIHIGLRRQRPRILDMLADSALAARGLVDPDALRATLLSAQNDFRTTFALELLLGCENWIRAASAMTTERSDHAPAIAS